MRYLGRRRGPLWIRSLVGGHKNSPKPPRLSVWLNVPLLCTCTIQAKTKAAEGSSTVRWGLKSEVDAKKPKQKPCLRLLWPDANPRHVGAMVGGGGRSTSRVRTQPPI